MADSTTRPMTAEPSVPRSDLQLELLKLYSTEVTSGELRQDAWDELEALAGNVEAPRDWAREHDHYLYGAPKRAS